MRKLLVATVLLILGSAGTAAADHYRGRDYRDRSSYRDRSYDRRVVRDRGYYRPAVRERYVRRPVYINNNRYTFHDGRTFHYRRPVIARRYYDYRYRPTVLIENYDTVPGYVWVAGNWNWNGYEWIWVSGHYEVDVNYDGIGDYRY
jgi:hypothetical protein